MSENKRTTVTVQDYQVQLRLEKAIIEALDLWDEREVRKVLEEVLANQRRAEP